MRLQSSFLNCKLIDFCSASTDQTPEASEVESQGDDILTIEMVQTKKTVQVESKS